MSTGEFPAKRIVDPRIQAILDQYPDAHLLLPSQTFLENVGGMQQASVEVVHVKPDPEKKEVYPIPGELVECTCKTDPHKEGCRIWQQRVCFHASTFERMAMAAGISYHPDSGYTIDTPERCAYKALAMMRKSDGTWRIEPFEKSQNLATLAKKFQAQYKKKVGKVRAHYKNKGWNWPGDDEWIQGCVDRDLLQKEEYLRELVQTGAKKRAVQHYLGLKSHYTRKELLQPFLAIRIDFKPDLSDPATKRFLLEQGTAAAGRIYPAAVPQGQDITDHAEVVAVPEAPAEADYAGLLDADATPEDPRQARILEIESMGAEHMQTQLIELMKSIHYDLAADSAGINALWKDGKKAEAVFEMEEMVKVEGGGDDGQK